MLLEKTIMSMPYQLPPKNYTRVTQRGCPILPSLVGFWQLSYINLAYA